MQAESEALMLMRQALGKLDDARVTTTAGCYLQFAIDILAAEIEKKEPGKSKVATSVETVSPTVN